MARTGWVKVTMDIPKSLRIEVRKQAAVRDSKMGPEIVRALEVAYGLRSPDDLDLNSGESSEASPITTINGMGKR